MALSSSWDLGAGGEFVRGMEMKSPFSVERSIKSSLLLRVWVVVVGLGLAEVPVGAGSSVKG